ncbi:MAG: hypothetical protein JNM14_12355 [Ferruginibacter sp.]|nr:hypothetical protein [Ferruginibacter sp.]
MKKIFTSAIAFLLAFVATAQVPDIMNYQAVARNNSGQALINQTIKVRLSVLKNAVMQYSETRQVVTNALGLFNIQIGSSGTLATTGSFSGINWQNNAAPGYVLKVELDINNSGLFTDMGSQSLVTVPYSFATKKADEAIEPVNINGKPIDRLDVPAAGDRLAYDGAKWVTVKRDTIYQIAGAIANIPVTAGNPFVFAGVTTTVTVTGTETIVANLSGSFAHSGASAILAGVSVCYQDVTPGSNIISFHPTIWPEVSIHASPIKTLVFHSGAVKLPAGTYKIGLGLKNQSIATVLNANDDMGGTVEIRY